MSDSERIVAETHVEEPDVVETPDNLDPDVPADGGTEKVPDFKIPEVPKDQVPQATALTPEDFNKFSREFQEKGALSDQTYEALAKAGIQREIADSYIEGQMARMERDRAAIAKEVGGPKVVEDTLAWAAQNLPAERIAEINESLANSKPAIQAAILRGLAQEAGVQKAPALAASTGAQTTDAAYTSESQFYADIRSPKYKTDPEFKARVDRRLKHSMTIGTIR